MDDNILNTFKLPIEYTDYNLVEKHIIDDLELDKETNPYSLLINDKSELGKIIEKKWCNYYSHDKKFIKSQQKLFKNIKKIPGDELNDLHDNIANINNYYSKWNEIKILNREDFINKYDFVSWNHLNILNKYPLFLQCMTYYNLSSPLINIMLPIILMVVPFFIIKMTMKEPITFGLYKSLLFNQLKNHSIGKVLYSFCGDDDCVDMNTKIYAASSFAIYLFTIYQNILSCIKFYKNAFFIQSYLYDTKNFIESCNTVKNIIDKYTPNKINNEFSIVLDKYTDNINMLNDTINGVDRENFSISNINNVGSMMHTFYEMFTDSDTDTTILYWFGYSGYVSNILGFVERLNKGDITSAKISSNKKTSFNGIYYPFYIDSIDNVINDVKIDKNIIITGPNASGKTTILKSVFINILLTQQFGYGCYSKCTLTPYNRLFSYINIPDTSDRDSLFQAEARRCLGILDYIREKDNKNSICFCIFDELFSGTNPDEAQKSALAFLKYLKKHNVDLLLTTHFNKIKTLNDNKYRQKHMDVIDDNESGNIKYTYKIKNGYSNVNGAIRVLRDMNYPEEIINELS